MYDGGVAVAVRRCRSHLAKKTREEPKRDYTSDVSILPAARTTRTRHQRGAIYCICVESSRNLLTCDLTCLERRRQRVAGSTTPAPSPKVCALLQPQNATAAALQQRSNGGANPSSRLPSIAKPDGVSADTHDLVLKTMRGGEQWGERKKADYDDALVALRVKRLAELRARAAKGGADGAAAALVSEQLEDLDGERLTRCLCTMDAHDVVVVHVHANNNSAANSPIGSSEGGGAEAQLRRRGSALLDAALATLSRRHDAHRKAGGSGGGAGAGSGAAGRVHSSTGASGSAWPSSLASCTGTPSDS